MRSGFFIWTVLTLIWALIAMGCEEPSDSNSGETIEQSLSALTCETSTVSFQQGQGGYNGTLDTRIRESWWYRDTSYENETSISVDHNNWDEHQGLIRFESIFQTGGIPTDKEIVSAELNLYGIDSSANNIAVHQMYVSWAENTTWNDMSSGVSIDGSEAASTPDDVLSAPEADVTHTVDVTSSINDWQTNPSNNFGWVLVNDGSDGFDFNSSENSSASLRPELVVTFCSDGGGPDPCDGVTCDTPPANYCVSGDTLRAYDQTGTCADGNCTYAHTDTYCSSGCSNGACNGDPCEGITCDTPPADYCVNGSTLRSYDPLGTCADGNCSYSYSDSDCAEGCEDGACNSSDPCDGVTCDTPPADECLGYYRIRVYDDQGICADGSCSYGYSDQWCWRGCSNGVCGGTPDPCDGVTCSTPPADYCLNSSTVRSYDPQGSCSDGDCSYGYSDIYCQNGCSSGACSGSGGDEVTCTLNPYEGVNWSTWGQYKANFHTHTTNSDGSETPSEVIDEYNSADYAILAITDHNVITWPWTSYNRNPAELGMLAVRGDEYSNSDHMNAYYNFTTASSNFENGIAHVESSGGLSQINHPGRERTPSQWSWYVSYYQTYASCIGLEVFNQGDRYPQDRQLWDNINENYFESDGEMVWGYSNDDKHNQNHLYRNFQFMLLPELTETALRDAQENGSFYFSYEPGGSGNAQVPRISNIIVDHTEKTITIVASGYNNISWIGPGTTVMGSGTMFDYSDYTDTPFVRIVLDGSYGDSFTQPFGFETTP